MTTVIVPVPLAWSPKDPNEILDFQVDWTAKLAGDTIATSAFTIVDPDSALVIQSQTNTDTTATVWLSGGTLGSTYDILNRITTAGGRTFDQTVNLLIATK